MLPIVAVVAIEIRIRMIQGTAQGGGASSALRRRPKAGVGTPTVEYAIYHT